MRGYTIIIHSLFFLFFFLIKYIYLFIYLFLIGRILKSLSKEESPLLRWICYLD